MAWIERSRRGAGLEEDTQPELEGGFALWGLVRPADQLLLRVFCLTTMALPRTRFVRLGRAYDGGRGQC